MLDDLFKLIMKRRLSSGNFEFKDQIAIKYWLWNALLQKSFQVNIVIVTINSECLRYNLEKSLWYWWLCFSNLAVKKLFLLLKSLTFEHILAKRTSCEIYTPDFVWIHTMYVWFYIWASAWDFQQCGLCDQQHLRSACAYAQSDQSFC